MSRKRRRHYKDIMTWTEEQKNQLYSRIDRLHYDEGVQVKVREHDSRFPAITLDVEAPDAHIHVITDCLSAEAHAKKRRG